MSSLKETILAAYPPKEGDNWLTVDLDGHATYHNRKPTKVEKNAVPGVSSQLGYWVTYEHYRNLSNVLQVCSDWRNCCWEVQNGEKERRPRVRQVVGQKREVGKANQ